MSRRTARAVERLDPSMAHAVRASAGEQVAEEAVRERGMELGAHPSGGMMLDRMIVGENYYVWTSTFMYVGTLVDRGIDCIDLTDVAIVLFEGRSSTLHLTGRASNMEVEPITLPGERIPIAVDVIHSFKLWPHALFRVPFPA